MNVEPSANDTPGGGVPRPEGVPRFIGGRMSDTGCPCFAVAIWEDSEQMTVSTFDLLGQPVYDTFRVVI